MTILTNDCILGYSIQCSHYSKKRLTFKLIIVVHSVKKESPTIEKIFLLCKYILLLWNALIQHIYVTTAIKVGFNINNVLLGELSFSKNN